MFLLILVVGLSVADASEAPKITEHPMNMTVARNEPVTLRCKARGDPMPRYRWFKGPDGQPVRPHIHNNIYVSCTTLDIIVNVCFRSALPLRIHHHIGCCCQMDHSSS